MRNAERGRTEGSWQTAKRTTAWEHGCRGETADKETRRGEDKGKGKNGEVKKLGC
jgi:hypothetical protein